MLCLDKMGFTKDLRQNFLLDFVITLRLLHVLNSSLKVMEKVLNMAAMSCFPHFKTSYG